MGLHQTYGIARVRMQFAEQGLSKRSGGTSLSFSLYDRRVSSRYCLCKCVELSWNGRL